MAYDDTTEGWQKGKWWAPLIPSNPGVWDEAAICFGLSWRDSFGTSLGPRVSSSQWNSASLRQQARPKSDEEVRPPVGIEPLIIIAEYGDWHGQHTKQNLYRWHKERWTHLNNHIHIRYQTEGSIRMSGRENLRSSTPPKRKIWFHSSNYHRKSSLLHMITLISSLKPWETSAFAILKMDPSNLASDMITSSSLNLILPLFLRQCVLPVTCHIRKMLSWKLRNDLSMIHWVFSNRMIESHRRHEDWFWCHHQVGAIKLRDTVVLLNYRLPMTVEVGRNESSQDCSIISTF